MVQPQHHLLPELLRREDSNQLRPRQKSTEDARAAPHAGTRTKYLLKTADGDRQTTELYQGRSPTSDTSNSMGKNIRFLDLRVGAGPTSYKCLYISIAVTITRLKGVEMTRMVTRDATIRSRFSA
jgi:hypothetical protein